MLVLDERCHDLYGRVYEAVAPQEAVRRREASDDGGNAAECHRHEVEDELVGVPRLPTERSDEMWG